MSITFVASWASIQPQEKFKAKGVYVSDGDTYHIVLSNQEKERVRLAEVNCPDGYISIQMNHLKTFLKVQYYLNLDSIYFHSQRENLSDF